MSQGIFMRDLGTCILLASVVGFPHAFICLHVCNHTLMCTLHVYKSTVQPVAGHSLFLDIQVVPLFLKEFTCLYVQISATPLPDHAHIFRQYLQHMYVCIHMRWDVREAKDQSYDLGSICPCTRLRHHKILAIDINDQVEMWPVAT